jgi:hypothetical protein
MCKHPENISPIVLSTRYEEGTTGWNCCPRSGEIVSRLLLAITALFISSSAQAWVMPLDPQNRIHTGLSLTDSTLAPGVIIGLDSRMTRLIFVDVGGFGTLSEPVDVDLDTAEPEDLIFLRHGLTVTPGLRIPHRYGEGLNWDLTLRGGFGAVWASDASSDNATQVDPALLTGADIFLRKEAFGFRATARVFGFKPFTRDTREEVPMLRPQLAAEVVFQW